MDSAGAKSTMSRDIEELTQGKEQTSKTVQGHKANLSNPSKSINPGDERLELSLMHALPVAIFAHHLNRTTESIYHLLFTNISSIMGR